MRLKRGWTRKRIVEAFGRGREIVSVAEDAYNVDAYDLDALIEARQLVEAILRAALRERRR